MFKKLIKALCEKDTTEVYRGTVSKELLKEYQDGQKQAQAALDAWQQTRKECWKKVYVELGIDPDGDYTINPLTGQIMEEVAVESLKETASK